MEETNDVKKPPQRVASLNLDWISGLMFGIEFLFADDFDDDDPFDFGMAIDLGIIRILFAKGTV